MSGKDPFDFDAEADKTVIRPAPGARPVDQGDRTIIGGVPGRAYAAPGSREYRACRQRAVVSRGAGR